MSRSLESLQLKHTNVSQPRLERTQSERSMTASEDYYSLSSASSTRSDSRASHPRPQSRSKSRSLQKSETPPSPYHNPRQSYEGIALPVSVRRVDPRTTPMRGFGIRRAGEDTATLDPPPPIPTRRGSPVRRKPVPSTVFENPPRLEPISIPPTALSSAAMQIARQSNPPTPEPDDTEYVRFALDSITRDEGETHISPGLEYNQEKGPFWPEHDFPLPPEIPYDDPIPIPPRSPKRGSNHNLAPSPTPPAQQHTGLLTPFEPPADSFYTSLTALPPILRPIRFGVFIVLLALFLVALLFTAIWSRVRTGLWDYDARGDNRYFVFKYLPTMFGMVLLLWLFEIQKAVFRIAPFLALASESTKSRSHGALLPLVPSGFALPSLMHFKAGQTVIGLFMVASWSAIFTIPLLASSFNVYNRGRWVWLATQGTIWTVIALYSILLVACVTLLLSLRKNHTGLKWDARTLADLIVIIERSNILDDFADIGYHFNKSEFLERSLERQDKLGYWNTPIHPNDIFHTIGAPDRPARPYSGESQLNEKFAAQQTGYSNVPTDVEAGQRPYSYGSEGTHNTTEPVLQGGCGDSYLPWFLRNFFVLLWFTIALALLIAFLVVSYLSETAISRGFLPALPAAVNHFGFSSSNFLYSFIPSLLGLLCFLLWQPFDLAVRRLQPYSSMSRAGGCLAEKSLLLSYCSDLPFSVTLKAIINGHIRVAITSLITLIAATLPILGGGVFWSEFYIAQQRVRVSADMPAFYALTVFILLYVLAYLFAFVGHKRKLPNRAITLADNIALLHESRLLNDSIFHAPATRTALVTRLLSVPVDERPSYHAVPAFADEPATGSRGSLADSVRGHGRARAEANTATPYSAELPRYGYGKYFGRDGKQHTGIDRVGRNGVANMVIRL